MAAHLELSEFESNYEATISEALRSASLMSQEVRQYGDISESLNRVLYNYNARVHFYGSRVIGIANEGSDLDIFISVDNGPHLTRRNAYNAGRSRNDQIRILEVLRASFANHRDWNVERSGILYRATVPILYAHYTGFDRDLHCEIAVRDGRAVATTNLLQHLFNIQPQAKNLFHFVRIWFKRAGILLKGYQVTLLVLFYLQSERFMPSIAEVQRNVPLEEICDWPVQFDIQRNLGTYGCLWLGDYRDCIGGFFNFYANFDYENRVIFPNFGYPIEKILYPSQRSLQRFPQSIRNFEWDSPMAMAGPFSLDKNVTLSIKQRKLSNFRRICRLFESFGFDF